MILEYSETTKVEIYSLFSDFYQFLNLIYRSALSMSQKQENDSKNDVDPPTRFPELRYVFPNITLQKLPLKAPGHGQSRPAQL